MSLNPVWDARAGCPVVCRKTSSSGRAAGRNRRTTAFITLNAAVFAPMPSASVTVTTIAKRGVRRT